MFKSAPWKQEEVPPWMTFKWTKCNKVPSTAGALLIIVAPAPKTS